MGNTIVETGQVFQYSLWSISSWPALDLKTG